MPNIRRISIALASALVLASGARSWARPTKSEGSAAKSAEGSEASGGAPREPSRAFVKLDVRADPGGGGLYVGQAVPVTIRANFLGGMGVSLNGLPRLTSDAFVLSDLPEKPRQTTIEAHGLPYTSVTWTGVLTAVKAGVTKVGIELPVSLTYREAPQPRALSSPDQAEADEGDESAADPFASLFKQSPFAGDPFFARMFNGRDPLRGLLEGSVGAVRQRDITLRDQSGTLRVLDLPPGAPPGFTGAVGSFEMTAALASDTFRAGEPITLALRVRGRGSFSRLSIAGLPASGDLGTYGVTSAFTAGATPTAGEKVFSQTIAPRRAGAMTVPALTMTYLDPDGRRYVTRRTAPMHITVAASVGDGAAALPAAAATPAEPVTRELTSAQSATIASAPAAGRAALTPDFRTRWFRWLAAAIGLSAVALASLGRTYRNGTLRRLVTARRVRREVAQQRRTIDAAAASGDAVTLFGAARKAFQARLGAAWGVPADAIAAADVATRLGPPGERIQRVFERADRLTYSGGSSAASEDLSYWQGLVSDELRALETTT
jgi:hypothetical protein